MDIQCLFLDIRKTGDRYRGRVLNQERQLLFPIEQDLQLAPDQELVVDGLPTTLGEVTEALLLYHPDEAGGDL